MRKLLQGQLAPCHSSFLEQSVYAYFMKVYRHPSCLIKHRWEHTPHWREASKLMLSKHQQVQLLEVRRTNPNICFVYSKECRQLQFCLISRRQEREERLFRKIALFGLLSFREVSYRRPVARDLSYHRLPQARFLNSLTGSRALSPLSLRCLSLGRHQLVRACMITQFPPRAALPMFVLEW